MYAMYTIGNIAPQTNMTTAKQVTEALVGNRLAQCNRTGKYFDLGMVKTVARYSDCTVFKCPACDGQHDDRVQWGYDSESGNRMGYTIIHSNQIATDYYGY